MKKNIIIYIICSFCFGKVLVAQTTQARSINFTLHISHPEQQRTFSLKLHKHVFERRLPDLTLTSKSDGNGNCFFSIKDPGNLVYITIEEEFADKSKLVMQQYLAEPGDDIHIEVVSEWPIGNSGQFMYFRPLLYQLNISGKKAAKYQCRYEFDKMQATVAGDRRVVDSNGNFVAKDYKYVYYDLAEKNSQQLLLKYKRKLRPEIYNILQVDFISALEIEHLKEIPYISGIDSSLLKKVKASYAGRVKKLEKLFTPAAKNFSPVYGLYALEQVLLGKRFYSDSPNLEVELNQAILKIKDNYSGEVRDKALTFLGLRLPISKVAENVLNELLQTIETRYCLDELTSYADKNFVGRTAFPFSLPDSSGRIYKQEDFKGKVVFIDFWFNGCGNCAIYYNSTVSKVEEIFRNNPDVVFVTINTDKVYADWIAGLKKGIYTSTHVINLSSGGPDHPIVNSYRAWGAPKPLIIGRDGKIFSNDNIELRRGPAKLEETINRALKSPSVY